MDITDDPAKRIPPGAADSSADAESPESEFLQTQLAVIEAYLQRFPYEQREFRALAWIEAHACAYRQHWQVQAATGATAGCRRTVWHAAERSELHPQWRVGGRHPVVTMAMRAGSG